MKKYIIRWDAGCGNNYEVIEADSQEEADSDAYDAWKDDVESHADYEAEEWTQELADDYGV